MFQKEITKIERGAKDFIAILLTWAKMQVDLTRTILEKDPTFVFG